MKTLFVSGTRRHTRPYFDVATRCRCFSLAGEFNCAGHPALVVSQEEFERNMPSLEDFDCYVFHRPGISAKLREFINNFGNTRKMIADFDDLLFDPAIARNISTVRKNLFTLESTLAQVSAIADAASLFGEFSLSTQPLKDHLEKMFPHSRATVVPNGLPSGFMGLCAAARKSHPVEEREYLFGYVSGTLTHDRDLAMIKEPLLEKLRDSGQRMLIVGPACGQDPGFDNNELVARHDLVPFSLVPELMSQCKYLLAPLENTIFNQAKSNIKFLEGALCGCVVLATPIPDIDRFESPLLLKCRTQVEWEQAIEQAGDGAHAVGDAIASIMAVVSAKESARKFLASFSLEGE